MDDHRKTKAQLIDELEGLRRELAGRSASDDASASEQTSGALEESERKFHNLAESMTAQVGIVQDDHYVYANQPLLDYLGLEADELHLATVEELMMGVLGPEAMRDGEPAWRAAVERGDQRFHFEYQDLDGSWFQTNVVMMELDGKPAFMSMDFDITELKRAQKEMYRADKMAALGQIVAGVAHEINNPNSFIYFNLPILRRYVEAIAPLLEDRLEQTPDLAILGMPLRVFLEDVFKLLENMEHGSERITKIVSDLKAYVRSDEDPGRKPGEVGRAVERVMTLVGKQVRKLVKRFDVSLADGLPKVEMNLGKIEQVLINLLINASQAADKEESWVELSARVDRDDPSWVELRVEDNGAGIPARRRERIFDPFYTSKGREQGTGLGLSISQRIVEEHGGEIHVESTAGEGSCFTVRLPAVGEDAATA